MKYKAYSNFRMEGQDNSSPHSNKNLPVAMIMVDGGTSRLINLRSTDDFSLVSELEQARSFKNIVLYLSSTKDLRDMKAAIDLMHIANHNIFIELIITVERFSGGKLLDGIALYETHGLLKCPPQNALKNTLMMTVKLSKTQIFQGKIQNHWIQSISKEL